MSKLLEQLRTDHINISKLLCIIENQVQSLLDRDNIEESMLIIRESLDYMRQYPSVCHHPREEVLIELLLELLEKTDPKTVATIKSIKEEHVRIEQLTQDLYQQVNYAVESNYEGTIEQVKIFLDFYYQHVEIEETLLFPLAVQLFKESDWKEIDAQFSDISDPLFTTHAETENYFIRLHKMILEHDIAKSENIKPEKATIAQ